MSTSFRGALRGKGALCGRRAVVLAAAVAAVGPAVRSASAVDYVYVGPGGATPAADGNWNDTLNWDPNTGFPTDIALDRAIFSAPANVPAAGPPVVTATLVSLNNVPQSALAVNFTHATGTYQIINGGAAGVLNVGAEGVDQTGAGISEITARVVGTDLSAWTVSAGTLRLTNVATTTNQNTLTGVTINLTGTATLQGNAAAGSSSLNGALLDVTGVAAPFSSPTIRLTSGETTTLAGINVHGAITFAPDNNHKVAGPINVDAGSEVRFGGAQGFRPQGTMTLAGATRLDVSGNWTFLNGPQNWGNNTVTKAGGGELQLVGFQGAPPAALSASHVVTGTVNASAGALITGANATINSLGTATINAAGGNFRIRPYAPVNTASVPMDNAVNVLTNDLQIQLDGATLSDAGGGLNNHVILGSAARPVTIGNAAGGRTLNISPVARQHDLTIDTVVLNNNSTIRVDVDNEVTGNPGTPANDRNVITVRTIGQDATARNFTKTGPDTLILNAGTYAGSTTVNEGTLQIGSLATPAGAFATSGVTLNAGGGVRFVAAPSAGTGVQFSAVTSNAGRIEISYANADLSTLTAAQLSDAGDTLRLSADQDTTAGATAPTVPVSRLQLNSNVGANYAGVSVAADGIVSTLNGARTYASPLALNGSTTFDTGGGNLTMSAPITTASGTGRIVKTGGNTLFLRAANNYSGGTQVSAGTLNANTGAALGSGAVAVATGGTLQFEPGAANTFTLPAGNGPINVNVGTVQAVNGITDLGPNAIAVTPFVATTVANALQAKLFNNSTGRGIDGANINANVFNAAPTVSTTLTGTTGTGVGLTSSGTFDFNGDNDFSTFFSGGTGGPPGGTNFTAAFQGRYTAGVTGVHTFTIEGNDDRAVIWVDRNQNGVFELAGSLGNELLVNDAVVGGVDTFGTATLTSGQNYNIIYAVEDTGGGSGLGGKFTEPAGGTVTTSTFVDPNNPAQAGRFSFLSPVGGGTVRVNSGADLRAAAVTGATFVDLVGGTGAAGTATFRVTGAGGQTASDATNLTLSLAVTTPVTTAPQGALDVAAGHTFTAGVVTIAAGGTLTKSGPGTLVVTGTGSGTGSLVIAAGTLGGSGSIAGPLTVADGAAVSPGTSPGILGTGNLTLAAGSDAIFELLGTTPGTGHDQLNVLGTVDLSGSDLIISAVGPLSIGDMYTIINNDGTGDLPVGTFSSGGVVSGPNGSAFAINYAGGDGNDVVLTTSAVPEPATAGLLGLVAAGLLARRRRIARLA